MNLRTEDLVELEERYPGAYHFLTARSNINTYRAYKKEIKELEEELEVSGKNGAVMQIKSRLLYLKGHVQDLETIMPELKDLLEVE